MSEKQKTGLFKFALALPTVEIRRIRHRASLLEALFEQGGSLLKDLDDERDYEAHVEMRVFITVDVDEAEIGDAVILHGREGNTACLKNIDGETLGIYERVFGEYWERVE